MLIEIFKEIYPEYWIDYNKGWKIMSLPKLKTPIHEFELPSTGEKIKYRPFLVKEQKILMIAQESENEKEMRDCICNIIIP